MRISDWSSDVCSSDLQLGKQAWQNGVMPLGRLAADELKRSLLPQFPRSEGLDLFFDTSEVPAMQEDEDKKAERWNKMVEAGWVKVAEAREACGLDVDDSHQIYLRKISMIEVPADGVRPDPADAADAAEIGRAPV